MLFLFPDLLRQQQDIWICWAPVLVFFIVSSTLPKLRPLFSVFHLIAYHDDLIMSVLTETFVFFQLYQVFLFISYFHFFPGLLLCERKHFFCGSVSALLSGIAVGLKETVWGHSFHWWFIYQRCRVGRTQPMIQSNLYDLVFRATAVLSFT